ncbi:hypothetical protein PTTG_04346 [Puccinia triticina 1-1 BBBD Race 1]|uniref:ditrans,polycis-polyprenyl diphosphate synthase [(2E,6E)-farnesyldiphosphate specific] n=2 Tax=Puccinia triticina TaxID=208348 RepID=A0A180GU57_PUCT1|nr:uncharacterized protein PtA15_4A643 [Puccinia triticina]OAV95908.1 hypothetical protein PTTG_04346 [Puccinia triticina 1-1 BBBD Race 1]WAQ84191.1 hypothetical protein PtA15_4A643 [Puccinia triticina]WAR55023.1 hypothetical protein PtB15_4B641 [Puccinia triticina]
MTASKPVRAIVAFSLAGTFVLLHLLHLVSHGIRLTISVIKKLVDEADEVLIACRVRTRDVRKDLRAIKKLPAHLAIIWIPINYQLHRFFAIPHLFSYIGLSRLERLKHQQSLELVAMRENFAKTLLWSMEAGIKEITFYDERGLMKSHKTELINYLATLPTFTSGNEHIMWASIEPKLTEEVQIQSKFEISYRPIAKAPPSAKKGFMSANTASAGSLGSNTITINLIDRHQGHEHLVKVTKALVEIVALNKQTKLNLDDLNVKNIGTKICSTSIGLPDLLLVLGGRSLRFRGFPPWQLTLTEIYHARSYGILPYKMRYTEYLEALQVFGNCQQRVGT